MTAALVTKPGSPYSEAQRDKDYDALKALYEKYDLKLGDVEAGVDPTTVDQKAGTADVRYTISVLRVGAVEITGNTVTHDDVIRRELRLRPGNVVTDSGLQARLRPAQQPGLLREDRLPGQARPGSQAARPGHAQLAGQGAAHRHRDAGRRLLRRSHRDRPDRHALVPAEQHQRHRQRRLGAPRARHARLATRSCPSRSRTSGAPRNRSATAWARRSSPSSRPTSIRSTKPARRSRRRRSRRSDRLRRPASRARRPRRRRPRPPAPSPARSP